MRAAFDIDEFIRAASQPGATAPLVREELGLSFTDSYINRLMKRYLGARPTRQSIKRPNLLREAVVAYMESQGLDKRYCLRCERRSVYDCAIHPLVRFDPTLDDFVFVCVNCSGAGDF